MCAHGGAVFLTTLKSRNVIVGQRRTSMRLEPEMWGGIEAVARREKLSISTMVSKIDQRRGSASLTSATRVFVLTYFRLLAEDLELAAHGKIPTSDLTTQAGGAGGANSIVSRVLQML